MRYSLFFISASMYAIFSLQFPVDSFFNALNLIFTLSSLALLFLLDKQNAPQRDVFFTCCIIFLGIMPRIEYSEGITYWLGSPSVFGTYEIATILSIIGVWSFGITFQIAINRSYNNATFKHRPSSTKVSGLKLIIISCLAVFAIYFMNSFSIIDVFYRYKINDSDSVELSQSMSLIYKTVVQPTPSICFVVYMLLGQRKAIVAIPLLVLMIIGNPITGLSRWQGAMLYLAALLSAARPIIKTPYSISGLIFFGMFAIFPILDLFRRYTSEMSFQWDLDWIRHGHFDSFQMFARAIELDFITYGKQLFSTLLFYIPRDVWPSKTLSSGAEIANLANLSLHNVSLNIFGEGFVNFGALGTIAIASMYGLLCAKLENIPKNSDNSSPTFYLFYLFFLGGSVFIFRGSLMSAFAYIIGTYISIYTIYILTRKKTIS